MPAPEGELRWDVRASVDDRRDQILRSLASFVRDRKLASLTMRDIADRLGLVKGNLYYYFKNKQDILYHCHVKCIAISLAALDEVSAMDLPPADALRALLVKHIRNITEDAYGGVLLTDLESLTPAQRKRYVAMRDRFEHGVRKMIRGGIADGAFAPAERRSGRHHDPWRDQLDSEVVPAGWADVLRRDRQQYRRSIDPVAASMSPASMHPEPLKVGEMFEGPSKTLTDAHFLLFSGLTGDVHPIHYDVEYAEQTRFGKPLAHGLLMVGMTALGASNARERIEGFVFIEQGCRFLKPAVVGDTIHPRFTVEKIWQEGERHYCRFKTAIINQRGETLLEGFHLYRVLRHEAPKEKS